MELLPTMTAARDQPRRNVLGEPGVLTIGSNYTQVPTASLVIQIAGTDPGWSLSVERSWQR